MNYYQKYLKYKIKYSNLKKQVGGECKKTKGFFFLKKDKTIQELLEDKNCNKEDIILTYDNIEAFPDIEKWKTKFSNFDILKQLVKEKKLLNFINIFNLKEPNDFLNNIFTDKKDYINSLKHYPLIDNDLNDSKKFIDYIVSIKQIYGDDGDEEDCISIIKLIIDFVIKISPTKRKSFIKNTINTCNKVSLTNIYNKLDEVQQQKIDKPISIESKMISIKQYLINNNFIQ
jgi:hypothetical protein